MVGSPPLKPPGIPGKNPGFRYWLRELGKVMRNALLFTLGAIGLFVLVKYFGKALVFAIPLFVLCFGVSLYSWIRMRDRGKKPPR